MTPQIPHRAAFREAKPPETRHDAVVVWDTFPRVAASSPRLASLTLGYVVKRLRRKGTFRQWKHQFGDPFLMNALNGPVVITGQPELIKQIFSHDAVDYDPFAEQALKPMLGAGSMLLLKGDAHRRERKLIMPMFHGDRMRAYANIMQEVAIEQIEGQLPGQPFNMLDVTTQISLKVIVRTILGGEQTDSINELMRLAREAVRRSLPMFFFSSKLHVKFFGLSPWDRFLKSRADLRAAVDVELARRQAQPADREDILTMLAEARYEDGTSMERERLYDELGTFMFAGHETSAVAMSWAIYHLHTHSQVLEKLRSELGELKDPDPTANPKPEELAQLPYLRAVVQETLRLNPVITEVLRLLKTPMQLGDYMLPAGTAVAPAIVMVHYDSEIYPEPDQFCPERFIERSYSSSEFLPFGGGHRRCAGATFAMYEMAIVLGTILSKYDFELLETKPVISKRRNVTMGPSTGIRVRYQPSGMKKGSGAGTGA